MKYASLVLLVTLASCGDSKTPPPPAKPATPDVGVAAKPADGAPIEPAVTPAAVVETAKVADEAHEVAASAVEGAQDGAAKTVDERATATQDKLDPKEKEHADAKKGDDAHAKSGDAAKSTGAAKTADAAATPAKVEELSVQVLQEGTGAVVKRGDTVTLEYTISYMPKPGADKKDDAKKKDAKGSKKSDAKKSDEKKPTEAKTDEKKPDDAKPKDEAKEADKPADEKKEPALAEHKDEAAAKTGEKPAEKHADEKSGDAKPADAESKSTDSKSDESKPADSKSGEKKSTDAKGADSKGDSKPVDPQKPVIVASTKSFTTPFTVKLTETGKPKLMPGLVRGVEGLKVGTRARILVPAALAYGKDGNKSAGIPPETPVEIEVFVKDARE